MMNAFACSTVVRITRTTFWAENVAWASLKQTYSLYDIDILSLYNKRKSLGIK